MKPYKFILFLIVLCLPAAGAYSVVRALDTASPPAMVVQLGPTATPTPAAAPEIVRPAGWHTNTHSSKAAPNYEVVFPQDKVNQLTITITPESWAAMQTNMVELMGQPGQGGGPGAFFTGGNWLTRLWAQVSRWTTTGTAWLSGSSVPQMGGRMPGGAPPGGGPPAGGGPGNPGSGENPAWITAAVQFEGDVWTNVGVRYKGNSSLRSSWNSGSLKLPLKLDFDQFESDYPAIQNQRFFGFKQLSLANGFSDSTFMRDTLAYYLLDEAGLPAAKTANYEVILDYGEGPVNLGLYTVIEVIDDTVIERYFGNDNGNIYEGDGRAVSLAEGTFDQIAGSFQKENHETEADWSDIETLYQVLHSAERTTNPAGWRANLEEMFDVDSFLEWLAISAALQHWDTYGNMPHNFYLYHNPDTNQLTWISWDHNMVLMDGPGGRGSPAPAAGNEPRGEPPAANRPDGGRAGGGPGGRNVSLDKAEVGDNWPLIRYLLDDPVYTNRYLAYLAEAGTLLNSEGLAAKIQNLAGLLRPHVDAPETFDSAVQSLAQRTKERAQAITDFLANR